MKRIIALGASNSKSSINKSFASWAGNQINEHVNTLDLNDFEMPIFSIDREKEFGIPQEAHVFKKLIKEADALVISFAEHNGSYSAAFKNILDWVSRIEKGTWANKPMLLLATSPGPRGAQTVLNTATTSFPHQGALVIGSFSLPSNSQNFDPIIGIKDQELATAFNTVLENLKQVLYQEDSHA